MEQDHNVDIKPVIKQEHLDTLLEVPTSNVLMEPIDIKTEIKEEYIIDGEITSNHIMDFRERYALHSGVNAVESGEENIGVPCFLDIDDYQTESDEESISSLVFEQTLRDSCRLSPYTDEEVQINVNDFTKGNGEEEKELVCSDGDNTSEVVSLPNSSQPVEMCSEYEGLESHLEVSYESDEHLNDENLIFQKLSSNVILVDKKFKSRQSLIKTQLSGSKCNFQCPFCFYFTTVQEKITCHIGNKHGGESVYSCQLCVQKIFSSLDDYLKHSKQYHSFKHHCEKCKLEFCNEADLESHSCDTNSKMVLLCCPDCKFVCQNKSEMERHVARAHKQRMLYCLDCKYETKDELKLNTHFIEKHNFLIRTFKEGKSFVCMFCDFRSTSRIQFNKHYFRDSLFFCHFCNFSAQQSDVLVSHVSSTHQDKILLCQVCNFRTYSVKIYVEHMRTDHTTLEDMNCSRCSFSCKDINSFERHLSCCHRYIFDCYFCNFKHFDEKDFQIHLSIEHGAIYCVLCALKFSTESLLVKHKRDFHGVLLHCGLCPYDCYDAQSLNEHLYLQHNMGFSCKWCDFTTNRENIFLAHINKVHGKGLPCKLCNLTFDNKRALNVHEIKTHCKQFECDLCHFISTSQASLKIHVNKEHADSQCLFFCPFGDFCTLYEFNHKRHLLKVHGLEELFCSYCKFKTTDEKEFELHLQNEHKAPVNPDKLNCPHCDYCTLYKKSLEAHINKQHVKVFVCDFCRFTCSSADTLECHVTEIHLSKETLTCCYCDFTAKDESDLKAHAKIHEINKLERNEFKCEQCDFMTHKRTNLKFHTSRCHDKPYKCHHCDFKSGYKATLKDHLTLIHGGEDPPSCPYCDYKTHWGHNMRAHIRRVHNKFKPYCCKLCDFTTSYLATLKSHMSVEHGTRKPFHCRFCSFEATYKRMLTKHLLEKHKENFPISEKNVGFKRKIDENS